MDLHRKGVSIDNRDVSVMRFCRETGAKMRVDRSVVLDNVCEVSHFLQTRDGRTYRSKVRQRLVWWEPERTRQIMATHTASRKQAVGMAMSEIHLVFD